MLTSCSDGLIGIRDRALLFAFSSGGRRRSEVASAVMENLVQVDAQAYLYRLTHFRPVRSTTQTPANPWWGQRWRRSPPGWPLPACSQAPFSRRVRKTKAVEPLSGQAVGHIVQRRAQPGPKTMVV